jgi:quercetin dioxygenase-like cupin family protein
MRTTTRTRVALAGTAATLGLAGATVALATPPSGETPTPLAHGTLVAPAKVNRHVAGGHVTIKTHGTLDALMLDVALAQGGTGGWHKHAGPLITIVKQGTLTIVDNKCRRHSLTAGQAFISPGSSPDKDENLGSTPVEFNVTFLLPQGVASPRIDAPAPQGCNA